MRNRPWLALAALIGLSGAAPCQATPPTAAWRSIATKDSPAALALIEANHPGAAPDLGDLAFQAKLRVAREHVAERLPRVSDYPAYAALMAGLSADFRDGHIWNNAIVGAQRVETAGVVVVRQGGQWMGNRPLMAALSAGPRPRAGARRACVRGGRRCGR